MNSKHSIIIMLITALLISCSKDDPVSVPNLVTLKYDDGAPSNFIGKAEYPSIRNRFSVTQTARLKKASFYIKNPGSLSVYFMQVNNDTTSMRSISKSSFQVNSQNSWFDVDFSASDIQVSGDFYIVCVLEDSTELTIGIDEVENQRASTHQSTSGWLNAYEWESIDKTLFIRAEVEY